MKTISYTALIIILFLMLSENTFGNVTGKAFLQGQTDHSGIKVIFIPFSQTAKLDSILTIADGSYDIKISGGIYQVFFSKSGYQDIYYQNGDKIAIAENDVLNDVILVPGDVKYVSGKVSGTWSKDHLYLITGDIIVDNSDSLIIESGTIVKFTDYYSINIKGKLIAIGTQLEPIIFTTNKEPPKGGDWKSIILNSSKDLCTIDNCIIEYCETCVSCSTYKANITNNEIRFFKYDGINGSISEFIIRNNKVHDYKGNHGIHIYVNSNGIIECNVVYDGDGYGIRVSGSFSAINNTVHDIRYSERGHGIAITGGSYEQPIIKNNLIYNCNNGIKIWDESDGYILNNTIYNSNNGISCENTTSCKVINNIIVNNLIGIKTFKYTDNKLAEISNNLIWNNQTMNFQGVDVIGIGKIVTTNKNGDSIDSYFNLYQDPLFINNTPPYLQNNSPCFGAGNPDYSENIGFDSTGICQEIPTNVEFYTKFHGYKIKAYNYPNPFRNKTNIQFFLPYDSYVILDIYNATGTRICTSIKEYRIAGWNNLSVDLPDITSGFYFYVIKTKDNIIVGRMVIE